ncbi:hypothetical protein M9H77_14612 [Catharanthus roseus]|uniref:Uncharacterized protein n=1 Tax=Catharanthus roseus TaxID=4058 RepID=A0ACC0BNT5_CATRO|nr:hypothetical protein M9H77_14612 [Catharanthus roseus]
MIARLASEIVRTKLRIKTSLYTEKLRKRKNLLVESSPWAALELMQAVEPFLNAAQEALPQVPADTVESFHFPIEMDNRVVVPANSNLRDIVRTGTISFSPGLSPKFESLSFRILTRGTSRGGGGGGGGSKETLCGTKTASS